MTTYDPVHNPEHYCKGGMQPIELILSVCPDALIGNVIRYICRYRYKGKPSEDLSKALQYLAWLSQHHMKPKPTVTCAEYVEANPDMNDGQVAALTALCQYADTREMADLYNAAREVTALLTKELRHHATVV